MRRFVIERTMAGVGMLTPEQLQVHAQKTNEVVDALAGRAQWVQSYVTDDKLYCVYLADDLETTAEHALSGGFVFDGAHEVRAVIDPTTAEELTSDEQTR